MPVHYTHYTAMLSMQQWCWCVLRLPEHSFGESLLSVHVSYGYKTSKSSLNRQVLVVSHQMYPASVQFKHPVYRSMEFGQVEVSLPRTLDRWYWKVVASNCAAKYWTGDCAVIFHCFPIHEINICWSMTMSIHGFPFSFPGPNMLMSTVISCLD